MSYDLYCYRSPTGKLDANEADEIISRSPNEISEAEHQTMEEIANDLLTFDPRLSRFEPDFDLIAQNQSISVQEAKISFDCIEINTPEDDGEYLQFNISKDVVSLSFGFGMTVEFLDRVMEYVEVISRKRGYLLYDPQDGSVTDSMHGIALSDGEAGSWLDNSDVDFGSESKPWWKFW